MLSKYLSLFVVEARKKNGEKYPPATLHQICVASYDTMRQINASCLNFLDKGDLRFKSFHYTLDALFHNLHTDGIGIKVKHAEIITSEEELKLWESSVMGLDTPASLHKDAFYTVGEDVLLARGTGA